MKTVLLPVKDFAAAKTRLADALSAEVRAGLARAMLCDVMDSLSLAEIDRVVVYTASAAVKEIARPFGFHVIHETSVQDHSSAVNTMLPVLSETASHILVIASDLPRLSATDIESAFSEAAADAIAILPSHESSGTNGLVLRPPAHIKVEYGEGSFTRHVRRAQDNGFQIRVIHIPGISFDIDTPDDLRAFLKDPRLDGETWRFIRRCGISL